MKTNYQVNQYGGNLTADVKGGEKFATFTVALDVGYGENKSTLFINCVAFPSSFNEKRWALLTQLKKGTNIGVRGDWKNNVFKTKDGEERKNMQLTVSWFELYSSPKKEEATPEGQPAKAQAAAAPELEDDDIPF